MEYSINKLAKLSGVSSRTLRYYDEIGLLKPRRISSSGYRVYGTAEVDALQQILFYRELGIELSEIGRIISSGDFSRTEALHGHLAQLQSRRKQLDVLIDNVTKTIMNEEKGYTMKDSEKFEGFKKNLVEENEKKYGTEIREKYGEEAVKKSNAQFMNMSQADYDRMTELGERIGALLKQGVTEGLAPSSEVGRQAAEAHKAWITFAWGHYSREAHIGLTEMYLADERFKAYYDKEVEGCALFLKEAVALLGEE